MTIWIRGGGGPLNPWCGPLTYGPGYPNTYTPSLIGGCHAGRADGMCKSNVDLSNLLLAPMSNYAADH